MKEITKLRLGNCPKCGREVVLIKHGYAEVAVCTAAECDFSFALVRNRIIR